VGILSKVKMFLIYLSIIILFIVYLSIFEDWSVAVGATGLTVIFIVGLYRFLKKRLKR